MKRIPILLLLLWLAGCASAPKSARHTGPWDVAVLRQPPACTWGFSGAWMPGRAGDA